jgi:acyl-CoA reductase-like NAD-dependent aldehyde dehydrogenase
VAELRKGKLDVPLIINGKEVSDRFPPISISPRPLADGIFASLWQVRTGNTGEIRPPHDHQHLLGVYHKAGEKEVKEAIEGSLAAHKHWRNLAPEHRLGIFMKVCSSGLISPV